MRKRTEKILTTALSVVTAAVILAALARSFAVAYGIDDYSNYEVTAKPNPTEKRVCNPATGNCQIVVEQYGASD